MSTDDRPTYPPRCSQCGNRWIDMACGPTHAIITGELGMTQLRLALADLSNTVHFKGYLPQYHGQQVERLADVWPILAAVLRDLLSATGEPVPTTWRSITGVDLPGYRPEMPRPGPRRPPVVFRLSQYEIDQLDSRGVHEGLNRSALIRRLVKYALINMPKGWT